MAERIDPGTLGWVQAEIEQTITQATEALDAWAAAPADLTPLRMTGSQLHQVGGTLQMVELDGASRLAGEVERLLEAVVRGDIEGTETVLDLVRGGLNTLAGHLDDLRLGGYHIPLQLLPNVNELRAGRGAEPVDPLDLFSPDMAENPPTHDARIELEDDALAELATNSRREYMAALLGWLKNNDTSCLDALIDVLDRLWAHARINSAAQAWWVGAALAEVFRDSGEEVDREAKALLGRLDQRIRVLAEDGESALIGDRAEDLVGRMLYEIGLASERGPRATQVASAFALAELLGVGEGDTAVQTLRAAESFSDEAMAEIALTRDAMTAYFDTPNPDPVALTRLEERLGNLSERAQRHELGTFGGLIGEMHRTVRGVVDGTVPVTDRLSLQLAGSLLFIENTLKGNTDALELEEQSQAGIDGLMAVREDADLPSADGIDVADRAMTSAELKQLLAVVATEIHSALREAEESLEAYAATPEDPAKLDDVPGHLGQAHGALEMLGQIRAAEVVGAAVSVIGKLQDGSLAPGADVMDAVAFAIGGVEAYVDGIERDRPGLNRILERAMNDVEAVLAGNGGESTQPSADSTAEAPQEAPEPVGESAGVAREAAAETPDLADVEATDEATSDAALAAVNADTEADEANEADELSVMTLAGVSAAALGASALADESADESAVAQDAVEDSVTESGHPDAAGAETSRVDGPQEIPEASEAAEPEAADPHAMAGGLDDALDAWLGTPHSGDSPEYRSLRQALTGVSALADSRDDMRMGQISTEVTNLLDIVAENPEVMSPDVEQTLRDSGQRLTDLLHDREPAPEARGPDLVTALSETESGGASAEAVAADEPVAETPVESHAPDAADEAPAAPASHSFVDDDMAAEILEIFLEEAGEVVLDIDTNHERLEANPNDTEALKEVRRGFHTLKGSGRIAGVVGVGELAWTVEDLLNEVLEGTALMTPSVTTLIGAARQHVGEIIEGPAPEAVQVDVGVWEVAAAHARRGEDPLPALINASADAADAPADAVEAPADAVEAPADAVEAFANAVEAPADAAADDIPDPAPRDGDEVGASMDVAVVEAADTAAVSDDATAHNTPSDANERKDTGLLAGAALAAGALGVASIQDDGTEKQADASVAAVDADQPDTAANEPEPVIEAVPAPVAAADDAVSVVDVSAPVAAVSNDDNEPGILEIFTGEASAHLAYIGQWLEQGEAHGSPRPVDDELIRAVHTLRGTSRAMELTALASVFEPLDGLLTSIDDQGRPVEGVDFKMIERGHALAGVGIHALADGRLIPDSIDRELHLVASDIRDRLDVVRVDVEVPALEPTPVDQEIVSLDEAATQVSTDSFLFDDFDLSEIFLEETVEILERYNESIERWRADGITDREHGEILRELHTLKGGARTAGFAEVADLAHNTESLLEGVSLDALNANPDIIGQLEEVHDSLAALAADSNNAGNRAHVAELAARFAGEEPAVPGSGDAESPSTPVVSNGPGMGSASVATAAVGVAGAGLALSQAIDPETTSSELRDAVPEAAADPVMEIVQHPEPIPEPVPADVSASALSEDDDDEDDRDQHVRVSTRQLDNLVNYAGEASVSRSRMTQQFSEIHDHIRELDTNVMRFREQLRDLEIQAETQMLARSDYIVDEEDENFDPLEFDRFSRMQTLARSLSENLEDLSTIKVELARFAERAEDTLQQQSHIHTDLQDGLMRTRMVTISEIIPRLRHIVRQTSRDLGKQARLDVVGGETEVDRNIVNRVVGPLEHMLRNALDHGLEDAQTRLAAGKSETGVIKFVCRQEGGEVVIELADDGAGLNTRAIRAKAIKQGLVKESDDLPEAELFQLLFMKGFSTAESLTQVSGRGVGMDVVHDSVRQLGGSVVARSQEGSGTTFTLRLPMTLAITHALVLRVGGQRFAVPLRIIKNIVKVAASDIERLTDDVDQTFEYQGQKYPLMRLADALAIPDRSSGLNKLPILLLRLGASDVAVQVDEAVSTEEVVVKPLGRQLESVPGVQSATVLGDGSVVLVLEMADLWSGSRAAALDTSDASTAEPTPSKPSLPPQLLRSLAASGTASADSNVTTPEASGRDDDLVAASSAPAQVDEAPAADGQNLVESSPVVPESSQTPLSDTSAAPESSDAMVSEGVAPAADVSAPVEVADVVESAADVAPADTPAVPAVEPPAVTVPDTPEEPPLIMVVDDSLTVRKVTERTLNRYDFESVLARDGIDALEQLESVMPDIMLVDIEMPRMDGFELTRQVRESARLKGIPIVIITSRAGQRHRDKAMSLGATEYLSKPYQEDQLIETICQHVARARMFMNQ